MENIVTSLSIISHHHIWEGIFIINHIVVVTLYVCIIAKIKKFGHIAGESCHAHSIRIPRSQYNMMPSLTQCTNDVQRYLAGLINEDV